MHTFPLLLPHFLPSTSHRQLDENIYKQCATLASPCTQFWSLHPMSTLRCSAWSDLLWSLILVTEQQLTAILHSLSAEDVTASAMVLFLLRETNKHIRALRWYGLPCPRALGSSRAHVICWSECEEDGTCRTCKLSRDGWKGWSDGEGCQRLGGCIVGWSGGYHNGRQRYCNEQRVVWACAHIM